MKLEIIALDPEGYRTAQESGADRIELCADPMLGGTTPSKNLILNASQELTIPFFVMIRPRGGDFIYNSDEIQSMLYTIAYCKSLNVEGIVVGCLDKHGAVDMKVMEVLVAAAEGMSITFHRAFDEAIDPYDTIEKIIELGCKRVLTSGQKRTAEEGSQLLISLIDTYGEDIIIMPGSGITATNISDLHQIVQAKEYHSSAKMLDINGSYLGVDANEVYEMKQVLLG